MTQGTGTSQTLHVALNPSRIEVEPGGPPVEATITLRSRSEVVEQYTVELVGIDPSWFDLPVTSVGLFPHDQDQLKVIFRVPAQAGSQAGTYPIRLIIRSSGSQARQAQTSPPAPAPTLPSNQAGPSGGAAPPVEAGSRGSPEQAALGDIAALFGPSGADTLDSRAAGTPASQAPLTPAPVESGSAGVPAGRLSLPSPTIQVVEATLDVRVVAVYQLDLIPREQAGRGRGTFQLQITNAGAADLRLALMARPGDGSGRVDLPQGASSLVPARQRLMLPVILTPTRSRWVGPEQAYAFSITVRPQDARGEPQTISGRYLHRPWIASWEPVRTATRRFARPAGIVLLALGLLLLLLLAHVPARIAGGMRAAGQATGQAASQLAAALPLPGRHSPEEPRAAKQCTLDPRVAGFSEADAPLVGQCASSMAIDRFGNGVQNTTNGVLFWLKASDTVYFFSGDSVYVLIDGRFRLLRGSGRR